MQVSWGTKERPRCSTTVTTWAAPGSDTRRFSNEGPMSLRCSGACAFETYGPPRTRIETHQESNQVNKRGTHRDSQVRALHGQELGQLHRRLQERSVPFQQA